MGQNILDLLRREHAKVLSQLDELQRRGISDRAEKFNQMKNNLLPHMAGEERVFYPRLDERGLHDLVAASREEHAAVRALVGRLNGLSPADEEGWVRVMPDLREAMRSHVDREEKVVFPAARQEMDDALLLHVGDRFEEAKGKAHLRPLR
ncbi:hemerythrin domain-containing protein [Methanoculleus sp. 7T]|uniref:hemerythrin domain-containing protein n=1 Tax=Methanoculleus sp. 7T TaxID=2937282 RepID=UPI0020C1041B|nr:hemerythrin domain-containing protein [Methanoculleus sp. 7T]MCK8519192.1 hemerythrin domain-containing protein [Methanoculleus sp. 7T]